MIEEASTGFSQIFVQILRIFYVAYTEGQIIWTWLSKPLKETMGEELIGYLGEDIANLAPFEFMFGAGIIIVLIYALVKFFMRIF